MRNSGFSLVELLVTLVFVALGSQMIQGGFLRAADMFGRYSNSIGVMVWLHERTAQIHENLYRNEPIAESAPEISTGLGKEFRCSQSADARPEPNLFSIKHSVEWTEGGKPVKIDREAYVYQPDPSQTL